MQAIRVLGALALSIMIGLCVILLLAPATVAPVYADDGPPRTRENSPRAVVTLQVDRTDDNNVTACTAAPNDCTLRGAINQANGDAANIYTIVFTPTIDLLVPLNPLPTITANELWLLGANGVPRIDGLFMSAGDPFTINANGVRLMGLSIVNVQDTAANHYADIRVTGGSDVQIYSNYLGTLPPSPAVTNCTPNPGGGSAVTRNAAFGVFVESGVTGSSGATNGSVYIGGNTIGCHVDSGVLLDGADYVHIGEDAGGNAFRNYIGVNASSVPLTQTNDGISMMPNASNNAPRYNIVRDNIIAGNGHNGIAIRGNGTANTNGTIGNNIIGNWIGLAPNGLRLSNKWNGVYLINAAFQNFVGGAGDGDGNIISGNSIYGVQIYASTGNGVLGNYIGTTLTGTAGVGNDQSGVSIFGGSANIVGGAIYGIIPATKGNRIYSNGQDGVQLISGTSNSLVTANDIRYNNSMGVRLDSGASNNIVGGDVISGVNIIGNNGAYGLSLYGSTTTGNVVKYNDILNNGSDGVILQGDTHDNEIGGTTPDTFNLIRYNRGSGIRVFDSGPNTISYNGIVGNQSYGVLLDGSQTQGTIITHTAITQNGFDGIGERNGAGANFWNQVSIYGNGGLGIDKEITSDTANVVNAPSLSIDSVNRHTGVVKGHATGSLLLVIDEIELYRIDLDPSGYGEGKTFVGSAVTDADGNWQIVDPSPGLGCYTAFESLAIVVPLGSSEFSRTSCAVMLPTLLR